MPLPVTFCRSFPLAYLKSKEEALWIATFRDVARYMRERMHATVRSPPNGEGVQLTRAAPQSR